MSKTALVIGAGPGISGAFATELADKGYSVCLACRNTDKLKGLAVKISARTLRRIARRKRVFSIYLITLIRILEFQIWSYITVEVGSAESS